MPKKHLTPVKAIRKKCLDCSGGSRKEVRNCVIHDCPLYPFRMGRNPNRKRGAKNIQASTPVFEDKGQASTSAKR